MKKVALVGSAGIPANYGGFETLAENLVRHWSASGDQLDLIVFCSGKLSFGRENRFLSARRICLPISANGIQSILYDILSLLVCGVVKADVTVVLGVSGGLFFPVFRMLSRSKIVVNIDGLEWRRAKWGRFAKWFLRMSELVAVRFSDEVVTDNAVLADYVKLRYGVVAKTIAYGGDHAVSVGATVYEPLSRLGEFGLSICRIEPENNVELILDAVSATPGCSFVFIGNWSSSDYGLRLKRKYSGMEKVWLLDPIYDLGVLRWIRSRASFYVHGHSAGGTNPSLVEMMFFGLPIYCFDCDFNRVTTNGFAAFFGDSVDLQRMIERGLDGEFHNLGSDARLHAERAYRWHVIAEQYGAIFS